MKLTGLRLQRLVEPSASWMNSCSSRRCAARFASPAGVCVEKAA
jgi:hypothetical protein